MSSEARELDARDGAPVTDEPSAAQEAAPAAQEAAPVAVGPAIIGPVVVPPRAVSGPSLGRSIATIALFVAGVAVGVGGFARLNAPPPLPSYPPLQGAPEPLPAHALAGALAANDADAIADNITPSLAQDLSSALQPIVDVTGVTYLGTVEQDGRKLAGYVVQGRDDQGTKALAGLVIDVSGNLIVGINQ